VDAQKVTGAIDPAGRPPLRSARLEPENAMPTDASPAPSNSLPNRVLNGPHYKGFVLAVTKAVRANNYLEIGVRDCANFGPIECASIGVDPNFTIKFDPMQQKPSMHLFQLTSDEYFRDHDPRDLFGAPVDVAFLDGLHLFDFLLRDFINTEKVCHAGSVVMLDDCLPANIEMTEREHQPELRKDIGLASWWTGDVYKVVSVLREYRPDLELMPVNVSPTGSIVIQGLDPRSTVLADAYDEIIARFDTQALPTAEEFEAYWAVNMPRMMDNALATLQR
jgi:hypothetical protein